MPSHCRIAKAITSSATKATTHFPPTLKGTKKISAQLPTTQITSMMTATQASVIFIFGLRALNHKIAAYTIKLTPKMAKLTFSGSPRNFTSQRFADRITTPETTENTALLANAFFKRPWRSSTDWFIHAPYLLGLLGPRLRETAAMRSAIARRASKKADLSLKSLNAQLASCT